MSKKANPTAVGLFVIIGSILLVAGFFTFSKFEWQGDSETYLLYFDTSVKGLSIGAPVTHRGVRIGAVTEILLRYDQAEDDNMVPVFIELKYDLIDAKIDDNAEGGRRRVMSDLIARGLRGQMQASSMLTGQLYIDLAFVDNAPEPVTHQLEPRYPEIPTVPSGIQAILDEVSKVNISKIAEQITSILEQLDGAITDLHMDRISSGLTEVMASINTVLIDPNLRLAIKDAAETLEDFKATSKTLRTEIVSVSGEINESLDGVQIAVHELREGVADIRHTLSADSPVAYNLSLALDELAAAAESISELANFLRLHPNALISGRESTQEQP